MTDQQRRFLESARRVAASRVGWMGNTESLPYPLREAYATELARLIVANPARFDRQTVATARAELGDRANEDLTTYTLAEGVSDAAGGLADGVRSVVTSAANVGEGVKSALNLTRWLIPAALIVAVVIGLWRFSQAIPARRAA